MLEPENSKEDDSAGQELQVSECDPGGPSGRARCRPEPEAKDEVSTVGSECQMITLGYGSRCWKGTTIQTTSMAITSMAIIDPIIILQPKSFSRDKSSYLEHEQIVPRVPSHLGSDASFLQPKPKTIQKILHLP